MTSGTLPPPMPASTSPYADTILPKSLLAEETSLHLWKYW